MRCPVCNIELRIAERQGIEIDYCPQCRGIWLDRGELDKIIERATGITASPQAAIAPPEKPKRGLLDDDYSDRYRLKRSEPEDKQKQKRDKRESSSKNFLEEIFDFFD